MMLKRNLAVIGICLVVFLLASASLAGNIERGDDPGEPGGSETGDVTGFVIMRNGDLDYYENDEFIETRFKFSKLNQEPLHVSFTGNAVYVMTDYYALWKCVPQGTDCHVIDSNFHSKPEGISFGSDGYGFVVTDNGRLDKYVGDEYQKKVWTFSDGSFDVSLTANAVYVTTQGKALKKCDYHVDNCSSIDSHFGSDPIAVSFDDNGTGFIIEGSWKLLKYFNNQFLDKFYPFHHLPVDISFAGDAVYVTTTGMDLYKCNMDGDCGIIDSGFVSMPNGVSFFHNPPPAPQWNPAR